MQGKTDQQSADLGSTPQARVGAGQAEPRRLGPRPGEDLLRQLASAHASYRLFPEDPGQPAFQAAVDRVRNSARTVLVDGDFHARIESARFLVHDEQVRSDETLDRFALACFERRIEHVHVHDVPSVDDLVILSDFLMRPIEEVIERGGARLLLEQAGLRSISVGDFAPEEEEEDPELAALDPDQRLLWDQLQDPAGLAASLLVGGMSPDPANAAQNLYARFRAIEEILPTRLTARRDFFLNIRQVFSHLPQAVGREFLAIVLTRLQSERFAMNFGVHLTDQELVDILFDLAAHGGPDPQDLGRRVVALTDRHPSVLELVLARQVADKATLEDLPHDEAASLVSLALAEGEDEIRSAAADALAGQLVDAASEDATAIREVWPVSDSDHRMLALFSLRDYLAAEDKPASLERVLGNWAECIRTAIVAGEADLVERLLQTVDSAIPADAPGFKRDTVTAAYRSIPTAELAVRMLQARPEDLPVTDLVAPLERFGAASLEAVLDALAEEETTSVRSRLLALAAALTPGNVDVIDAHIDDDRWYVVRNLVTILGRAGVGTEAVPMLGRLVDHPDAMVRREVVRSLVACAGSGAVPYLRRLATDDSAQVAAAARQGLVGIGADVAARALADLVRQDDDLELRREALDSLAAHSSTEVPDLLAELASRRGVPRLPRALRRSAKRHLRDVRRGRS
ncbi:MAG: HEAT repeat domain-containing protein [Actinobacteria bacterium]|nr:HEAT repeat domain-containing protein [Actinomycetota bacterium]